MTAAVAQKVPLHADRFTDPAYFAKHPKLEYVYILSTLLSQVFTQASGNAVLPLLDILTRRYNAGTGKRAWFMSSFALAQGTLISISGRIGDVYGLRRAILGGYIWTMIWSVLAGVATYVDAAEYFIVCRAMLGAGLAFVLPNAMGAAGRIYRPGTRRKHTVFSLIGLSAPLGGCASPMFTGLIGHYTSHWEWAFYHYAIAVFIGFLLAWWSIPHIPSHRSEDSDIAVDWIGCFLLLVGLVLFNFSWTQGPIAGWGSPYIIVLLIVSIVDLAVFLWYEVHIPNNPLVPKQVMQDSIMLLILLTLFLSWGSFGVLFYRFFVFIEDIRHYNSLQAGLSLWPGIPSGMTAALVCGWLISKVRAQFLLVFAMSVFVFSAVMLLTMPVHETYFRQSMGLWIFSVWGMDWSFPAGSIILSDELPPRFQGMAGSLLTTMVMYGQSLFTGISSTIETEIIKSNPKDSDMAVHKGCSYFAIGLSTAAFFVSVLAATMSYRRSVVHERQDSSYTARAVDDRKSFDRTDITKENEKLDNCTVETTVTAAPDA